MKAADLALVQKIVAERAVDLAMRDRLVANEPLSLTVGSGERAGAIVLTASYLAGVRRDVLTALEARIAAHDAALADLGVEP